MPHSSKLFAIDIAGFTNQKKLPITTLMVDGAGFNLQKLRTKISYDNDQISTNFIPANLKLGTGFDLS
jgi:hypothetical protein